jgi:1-hydroxycarotenoid 3,4-desaturase
MGASEYAMAKKLPAAKRVAVVGSGIGGLASALSLAAAGYQVTVFEKETYIGGKIRQLHGVDSGPTVFTLRWILDSLFAQAGLNMSDWIELEPLNNLARHVWSPGVYGDRQFSQPTQLDLFADAKQSLDAIGRFSGAAQAKQFEHFCQQARKVYAKLEGPYIRSAKPGFLRMTADLGPAGLAALAGLGPFASLWQTLGRHFSDPRLRQLFGRYATYCGASPWQAPATLMLIAQVEMDGVWSVKGGMKSVVNALAKASAQQGTQFELNTWVNRVRIDNNRVIGLDVTRDGAQQFLPFDSVVFNGDVAALSQGLLGLGASQALPSIQADTAGYKNQRSLSALTVTARSVSPIQGFDLVRHNVFFAPDYAAEFHDIFAKRRLPQNGTVYVCAQDRSDDSTASRPDEGYLALINAPAVADISIQPDPLAREEVMQCIQNHFNRLASLGLSLPMPPRQTTITTPKDFHRLFPATGGALYGQASHGWMNQFRRMGAQTKVQGLYLAGGSVHPGPGVPMAAMSGRLAAETLMADQDSTRRSKRVVIAGGTSTPLATTSAMPLP